jgi:HK97 family phage prohead protease
VNDTELRGLQEKVAQEDRTLLMPVEYEERAADGQDGVLFNLKGHAAVFDKRSEDLGGFVEVIKRGAFRKALNENQTVKALWEHEPRWVLGSTDAKTLDLREDPVGLHSYTQAPDVSYARDLQVLLKRGDVNQMSFGFIVGEDNWVVKRDDQGNPVEVLREIISVRRLFDVSVVAFPAYTQTDAQARGLALYRGSGIIGATPQGQHDLGAVLRSLGLDGASITININGSRSEELGAERGSNPDGDVLAEQETVEEAHRGLSPMTRARILAMQSGVT